MDSTSEPRPPSDQPEQRSLVGAVGPDAPRCSHSATHVREGVRRCSYCSTVLPLEPPHDGG